MKEFSFIKEQTAENKYWRSETRLEVTFYVTLKNEKSPSWGCFHTPDLEETQLIRNHLGLRYFEVGEVHSVYKVLSEDNTWIGDGPDPRSKPKSSASNTEGSHWGSGAYHNEVDTSGAWCDPDWTTGD